MLRKNKELLKRVLGNELYLNIKSKVRFNSLESPFPKYKPEDFPVDWNTMESSSAPIRAAYIVSPMQRSGTNYIGHLLNIHPSLSYPKDKNFPKEHCLYNNVNELKDYAYQTIKIWSKWTSESDITLDAQVKQMLGSIGNGLLDNLSVNKSPSDLMLLKTPDSQNIADYFHLFPNTKLIILLRDGRDTVESFMKSWGTQSIFKNLIIRWSDRMNQINDLVSRSKDSQYYDQIHFVNYQKLNDNTEGELLSIFKFLNLDPDLYPWDELKDIPVLGSSAYKNDDNRVHWTPVKKSKDFQASDKWHAWSASKKTVFKKIAGNHLIHWGFEESNNW